MKVFYFLLLLLANKSAIACAITIFYAPENGQVITVNWEPGQGEVPFSIRDAISAFKQNERSIVPYLLLFEDDDAGTHAFGNAIQDKAATFDTQVNEIALVSFPFWFYKIKFDLNVYLGENKFPLYKYGLNELGSKSSPYIGIALDGTILYPKRSTCG